MFKTKKRRYKLKTNVSNIFSKILYSLIFILIVLIINKINPKLINNFKNEMFNKSLNFMKINRISKKIIGKEVVYSDNKNSSLNVMNDELDMSNSIKYFNGEKFKVSTDLPISTFESGVVIYIGNKENFDETVIVQGVSGYNIWYGNLKDINVKNYDYVEKNSLIGSSNGNYVYIAIEKDGKFISYEDYKENKS